MAGTSYTRQSTIADGNIISASLFNNEFNQILNAFAYASTGTTGHQHDGGAGEGGNIAKIGDQDFLNKIEVDSTNNRIGLFVQVSSGTVEQVRIQDGAIVPVTDSDVDLGTSSVRFKDAFVDSVTTTTITAAGTTNIVTGVVTGDLTLTGADYNIVFDASASELKFNDNADLLIGTGGDLRIYHGDGHSRIKEQGTGGLYITADSFTSFGSSSGAQSLVVNASLGLEALAGGQSRMTVDSGGVNIPDSVKLNFGAADDLQIFHDGSDSRITDAGTGNLYITGSSNIKLLSAQTEYASFGTAVELRYNNSKKFETTNTGVAISGNATLSGAATAQAFNANALIDTPVLEVTTLKARDGSAAGSIANSTGVVTLGSAILTTADINGGTADNVVIGGSTAAAGTFTTIGATNLQAQDGTAAGSIANSTGVTTLNSAVLTTADINGGAIDGTTIGAAATAAGSFTTLNSSSTITSTRADNGTGLHLISTDADAASGPIIKFERDSASPADNDITGIVNFTANDDGDNNTTFVQFLTKITDASNGSESGHFELKTQQGGTFRPAITIDTIGGQAEVNINRFSADIDFRVEGSGQPALLFSDASTNRVGIKTATPSVDFEVNGIGKFTTAQAATLVVSGKTTATEGIYLGGTAAANLLDDYEEGTWTPAYEAVTTNPAYTQDSHTAGRYTKVGNVVHAIGRIRTDSASNVGGGQLALTLPFAVSSSSSIDKQTGVLVVGEAKAFANDNFPFGGWAAKGTTRAYITRRPSSKGQTQTLNSDSALATAENSNDLIFSITYLTDA